MSLIHVDFMSQSTFLRGLVYSSHKDTIAEIYSSHKDTIAEIYSSHSAGSIDLIGGTNLVLEKELDPFQDLSIIDYRNLEYYTITFSHR